MAKKKNRLVGREVQRDDISTAMGFLGLGWSERSIIVEMKHRGLSLKNAEEVYRRAKRNVQGDFAQRIR